MRNRLIAAILLCSYPIVAAAARAAGREPGSLLVYPIYDSRTGIASVITVTNTNSDTSFDPTRRESRGTVAVEYKYIDYSTCREFNRSETLTPNDTLTLIAASHNAETTLGYLYVFAKSTQTQSAITFNWLIGSELIVDGINVFDYGLEAYSFAGVPAEGANTDLDNDHLLDLNGLEYEGAPAELHVPRFFGQGLGFVSHLVLLNLTGGSQFRATVDFLIYNDNEQQFSAEHEFSCWTRVPLSQISGVFANAFLLTTWHDPTEILGLPGLKTGWMRINGGIASSMTTTLEDPAFLGFLEEAVGPFGSADLPFEFGKQLNGDLLSRSISGDQS